MTAGGRGVVGFRRGGGMFLIPMRATALLVLTLASACSGGGSSPFTPSQDLSQTHAWLGSTSWDGAIRIDGGEYPFRIDLVGPLPAASSTDAVSFSSLAPGIIGGTKVLQADGDRIRIVATDNYTSPGQITITTFDGTARGTSMNLAWRRESTLSVFDGDSGIVELQLVSTLPTVTTLETYETPELLLIVQTVRSGILQ